MDALRTGAPVFTSDGDKIGTVKEILGDAFKIDASGKPDFWLRQTDVMTSEVDRIAMRFDKDHLGDSKVDEDTVRSFAR